MRFVPESKQLFLGVREVVGQESGRWDIPWLPNRAELGRDLHAARRRYLETHHGTYRGEVTLSHTLLVRGYEVNIQGRIDGYLETEQGVIVEEFKSIALEPVELRGLSLHDLPAARLQLGIYLYLLQLKGVALLPGRVVVCSIFDPSTDWELLVEPFHDEVQRHLELRIGELLDELEARERWYDARRRLVGLFPFPHEMPRAVQQKMISEVDACLGNGGSLLLEAPTGVGKTAVALFSTLRLAYARGLRVFFVTAKTSGQRSAWNVVEQLRQKGLPLRAMVLTARDKICPQPVVYCHPEHCRYADRYHEKVRQTRAIDQLVEQEILDRDAFAAFGEQISACPFELSLELTTRVDLVICDYNYVFDPSTALKRIFQDRYDDWIVVVDEAHNLVPRSREYFSPLLSWRATRLLESWGQERGDMLGQRVARLAFEIQEYLWACLEESGLDGVEEGRAEFVPDTRKFLHWQQTLALLLYDDPLRRRWRPAPGEEDLLLSYYRQLSSFTTVALRLDETFTAVVERSADEMRLRILCHDASPALRKRLEGFYAALAMSATLSPPAFYRDLLGLPSSAPLASFPSPFPRARRGIFVVGDIPDRFRSRSGAIPRIAETVKTVMQAHPGSYALYVPSFEFLAELRGRLDQEGYELLVQDPRMDDQTRAALLRRLASPLEGRGLFKGYSGRLLVAVQGGSFAEGIEWPEGVLSGVLVVGPGLPRLGYEQELLKGYFEERYGDGFGYAYRYPGMARVIQAAGRLIRRFEDRGVLILMGERFAEPAYASLLPRDWYERQPSELICEDLGEALRRFWARFPD